MQNIITNINTEKNIYLVEKPFSSLDEVRGNCACLYIGFDIKEDKFILVSPANTYHLL